MRLALPCVLLVHENEHDTKNTNARKGTGEPQSFDPKTYLPSSRKAVAEQAAVKVRDSTELKQICLPRLLHLGSEALRVAGVYAFVWMYVCHGV